MNIMSMQVMQLHNIRRKPFQFFYKPLGSTFGMKSIRSENLRFESLPFNLAGAHIFFSERIVTISLNIKNSVIDFLLAQQLADCYANFAGTAATAHTIDLGNPHAHPLFPIVQFSRLLTVARCTPRGGIELCNNLSPEGDRHACYQSNL